VNATKIFEELESEVRSYCRRWPAVFSRANGSRIYDERGRSYIDFFAGAGGLNYGHNHPHLKEALLRYLQDDSIVLGLDMYTIAKRQFIEVLHQTILSPRQLEFKVQFPGPAGTTAVEAALRLARKCTGRRTVISFANAFHGMTLGALAVSSVSSSASAGDLGHHCRDAIVMPYGHEHDDGTDALFLLSHLLDERGRETPAAVIVETVQGEGGIWPASPRWLRDLGELCKSYDMLLIVDDIQMGCGRTGPFFSFERMDVYPDIVCLSKSLSGYGLPLSVTLFRPELDVWKPGEHTGTFRGTNPAFVTGTAALDFWRDSTFEQQTLDRSRLLERAVRDLAHKYDDLVSGVHGRGMAWGISFIGPVVADEVSTSAFERGLLVEIVGSRCDVVKLMPPLTISDDDMDEGLSILDASIGHAALVGPGVSPRA
jgi:diaminobutyrate-2-oxoglutarate transaminase